MKTQETDLTSSRVTFIYANTVVEIKPLMNEYQRTDQTEKSSDRTPNGDINHY